MQRFVCGKRHRCQVLRPQTAKFLGFYDSTIIAGGHVPGCPIFPCFAQIACHRWLIVTLLGSKDTAAGVETAFSRSTVRRTLFGCFTEAPTSSSISKIVVAIVSTVNLSFWLKSDEALCRWFYHFVLLVDYSCRPTITWYFSRSHPWYKSPPAWVGFGTFLSAFWSTPEIKMFHTFDCFVGLALGVLASAYLSLATAYQTCTSVGCILFGSLHR